MARLGFDLFTVISGLGIITMLFALLNVIEYKKFIPGGLVSKSWNLITSLVAFLFIVYLTIPFFILLSQDTKDLIVAFIFLFGAMYVLINIRLVYRIVVTMKGE
jgi:hypothetical protein